MAPFVYISGALILLACALLLFRGYLQGRQRLLLFSAICFFGLAISNVLIFVDLVVLPTVDLYQVRLFVAAVAMTFLMYGLIWEAEK